MAVLLSRFASLGHRRLHSSPLVDRIKDMGPGTVKLDTTNPLIAQLTLDNPSGRNALTGRMFWELGQAVRVLANEYKGIAVVVSGSGGTFCSGADLKLVKGSSTPLRIPCGLSSRQFYFLTDQLSM